MIQIRQLLSLACFALIGCGKEPANIQQLPAQIQGISIVPGEWEMVSFPLKPITSAQLVPAGCKTMRWDEAMQPQQLYSYYYTVQAADTIFPGFGYWLKCADTIGFSLDTLESFAGDSLVVILRMGDYGWNMIGNPWLHAIAVPDTSLDFLAARPCSLSLPAKSHYNAACASIPADLTLDTVTQFEPWHGYFVRIDVDSLPVTLRR